MAFFETPRFPEDISYGATGGPAFNTDVVIVQSGNEQRNSRWDHPLIEYTADHGVKTQTQLDVLIAFFRIAAGKAHGFRFKDWVDFEVTQTNGKLAAGGGSGVPTYQLQKSYSNAAGSYARTITKPVVGAATVYRNASPVTVGAGAGNIAIDYTTGIVTFVADATASASSITVGSTTQVVLATNPGTLIAGEKLHLSGFTGTDAALVNGLAHTINSVTGAGPFTFVLSTNTTGKTITLGSGSGKAYPQANDTLTWAGEFDVPMRFDTDRMAVSLDTWDAKSWNSIPLVELRKTT